MVVLIDTLPTHCRVHVCPDERDRSPWYSTTLIRDLDCDVFASFDNDDLDRRI